MRVLTSVSRITIGKGGQMTLDNGQTSVADRSRALDGKSFRNVSIRGGGHLTDINLKPCQNETLCKLQVFEENKFFGATLMVLVFKDNMFLIYLLFDNSRCLL